MVAAGDLRGAGGVDRCLLEVLVLALLQEDAAGVLDQGVQVL